MKDSVRNSSKAMHEPLTEAYDDSLEAAAPDDDDGVGSTGSGGCGGDGGGGGGGDGGGGDDDDARPMPRDVGLLALCWASTLSSSTLVSSVGPLSAKSVGASASSASFTIAAFLFGAALVSVPSAFLFSRFGRRGGFAFGTLFGALGGVVGMVAMARGSLAALFGACFLAGLSQGLGQFYRFAAVEVAPPHHAPAAVTLVLSGGVIAAFAGPQVRWRRRRRWRWCWCWRSGWARSAAALGLALWSGGGARARRSGGPWLRAAVGVSAAAIGGGWWFDGCEMRRLVRASAAAAAVRFVPHRITLDATSPFASPLPSLVAELREAERSGATPPDA